MHRVLVLAIGVPLLLLRLEALVTQSAIKGASAGTWKTSGMQIVEVWWVQFTGQIRGTSGPAGAPLKVAHQKGARNHG
jgi:hypothetical protein